MSKHMMELENIANKATSAIEDYLNGYDCFTDVVTIILNVLKEAIKSSQQAAPDQAGEPVGYRWKWPDGILPDYHPRNEWQFESTYPEIHPSNIGVIVIEPLYTAAPSMQAEQAPCNIPAGWQLVTTEFIDAVFDNLISSDSADHYRELMLSTAPSE